MTCAITGLHYDSYRDREDDVVIYHHDKQSAIDHCIALKMPPNVEWSSKREMWYFCYSK